MEHRSTEPGLFPPDSHTKVYEAGSSGVVFEGTYEDALAYTQHQRKQRTNLLVPNLVIAAGGLAAVFGLAGVAANARRTLAARGRSQPP